MNSHLSHRNNPITIIVAGYTVCLLQFGCSAICQQRAKRLAIVDRHPQPLTQWRSKTERQGMTFLRSPAVHHITPDALGIVEYAERHTEQVSWHHPIRNPLHNSIGISAKARLLNSRHTKSIISLMSRKCGGTKGRLDFLFA